MPATVTEIDKQRQQEGAAALETAGVAQNEPTVEADASLEGPTATSNGMREARIRVPVNVTDEQLAAAAQIGSAVIEGTVRGLAFLFFPIINKGQDGNQQHSVGQAVVPLANKMDVDRLLHLAQTIAKVNTDAAQKIKTRGEVARLAIQKDANRVKDNAARDLTAKAQGQAGGIIVAR